VPQGPPQPLELERGELLAGGGLDGLEALAGRAEVEHGHL